MIKFKSQTKLPGGGRAGLITTPHGPVSTPVFMPVGTQGSVKSLSAEDLIHMGAQLILANTYHLYLRPGHQTIKKLGGLHRFMNWPRPTLTDSGGFQVQSLGKPGVSLSQISEDGVAFTSHLDGSAHFFTPEKSIQVQMNLGADIIMAFDECTPSGVSKSYATAAMDRTHRWLIRCIKEYSRLKSRTGHLAPALFGIIQGGQFADLRRQSAKFVVEQDLPGIAIGGESIGSDPAETAETIATVRHLLPPDKPLYAMGVGVNPAAVVGVVRAGADMFDCVAPTRLARCGLLYHPDSPKLRIDINNTAFALDKKVIDSHCDCYTCQSGFTRGYLHHLCRSRELLFYRLATIHNLRTVIRTIDNLNVIRG